MARKAVRARRRRSDPCNAASPAGRISDPEPRRTLTIPNLITIAALILVPVVIVVIMQSAGRRPSCCSWWPGGLGRGRRLHRPRFDMRSEFGAYIDPLADKALLVSIYVTLAIVGVLPSWLAIVVVSRDLMIVGGRAPVLGHGRPGRDQAAPRRKLNTAAQIALAAFVLGRQGLRDRCGRARTSPWCWSPP